MFLQVHKEAVHYNIKPLIKRLEETPRLFGELVGRQQFLSRVPHYKENIEVSCTHTNNPRLFVVYTPTLEFMQLLMRHVCPYLRSSHTSRVQHYHRSLVVLFYCFFLYETYH